MRLEGVKPQREGADRLDGVEVVLTIHPQFKSEKAGRRLLRRASNRWVASTRPWTFKLEEVIQVLNEARAWLLENERGRPPVAGEPMSAADAALSKASLDAAIRRGGTQQNGMNPAGAVATVIATRAHLSS